MTGGTMAIGIAHPDERPKHLILRGDGLQVREHLLLAAGRGQIQRLGRMDSVRDNRS